LKKKDRAVLWLDYFNSTLSRREGRRVPISLATKNPTLEELAEAAKLAGYTVYEVVKASHPKRHWLQSGYVQVAKREGKHKSQIVLDVAKALTRIRATHQG